MNRKLTFNVIEKYHLLNNKFLIPINLNNNILICYENIPMLSWNLQLMMCDNKPEFSCLKSVCILNIPLALPKNSSLPEEITKGAHKCVVKPVLNLIQTDSISCQLLKCSKKNLFVKLFGIKLSSSNCVCIIGHPDGNIEFTVLPSFSKVLEDPTFQSIYNLKQPVAGIYFLEKIGEIKGYGFLLIIGTFGKIVLLSSEKCFTNASVIKTTGTQLWAVGSYLHVSIIDHFFLNESLFYVSSDEKLHILEICMIDKTGSKELKFVPQTFDLHGIKAAILLDKITGLILLITKSGNLHLIDYKLSGSLEDTQLTLPSLMAECLQQSMMMKELIAHQLLQRRLFCALSTFASLKFKETFVEEKFPCSASEVDGLSKKILLDINLKALEQFNLDPDLWHVTVSVYPCFQDAYTVITKTVPFNPGHKSLCLELVELELQPSSNSILPLFVEIGLILIVPETWKKIDCFKLIECSLPLYIRVKNFLVHELYFLQSSKNLLSSHESQNYSTNIVNTIYEIAMGRPISKLLKSDVNTIFDLPEKFQFCVPISSIQVNDACCHLSQIILKESNVSELPQDSSLTCRNKQISLNIQKVDTNAYVMISSKNFNTLLGLRMAIMEELLSQQLKSNIDSQTYISIPMHVFRKCEEVSEKLKAIDVSKMYSINNIMEILKLYEEIRADISGKLPVL